MLSEAKTASALSMLSRSCDLALGRDRRADQHATYRVRHAPNRSALVTVLTMRDDTFDLRGRDSLPRVAYDAHVAVTRVLPLLDLLPLHIGWRNTIWTLGLLTVFRSYRLLSFGVHHLSARHSFVRDVPTWSRSHQLKSIALDASESSKVDEFDADHHDIF